MSLKKGIFYVFLANAINLIVSLFSGFVLPKFLSIETYSDIKLFQLYITYIGILHLGFVDGMYLQYGGKEPSNLDFKKLADEFKTFKIFQVIIAILAIIISLLLKNKILLFCSLVIIPINIGAYLRNLYSSIGQFKKYSTLTNINTLLVFIINIFLLFIIKSDNSNFYIIGYIVAYFIYWIILEIECKKFLGKVKSKANKHYLKNDIQAGFLLMIGNFCNVIFTSIDRLFVKNLLGTIKFAFYSFAVSIENLLGVFITPISVTMYNYFCKHKKIKDILKIKQLVILFSVFVIACIFPAKFIIELWLTKYFDSISVLCILFGAQFISIIIRCIHINQYKALGKQNRYFIIMMLVVGLSILLNIIFYLWNPSMESIAFATLITNILWFIIGEIDFKDYRYKKSEYCYIILELSLFLICGLYLNAVIGGILYLGVSLILSYIFMKNSMQIGMTEVKKIARNFKKKFLKEEI